VDVVQTPVVSEDLRKPKKISMGEMVIKPPVLPVTLPVDPVVVPVKVESKETLVKKSTDGTPTKYYHVSEEAREKKRVFLLNRMRKFPHFNEAHWNVVFVRNNLVGGVSPPTVAESAGITPPLKMSWLKCIAPIKDKDEAHIGHGTCVGNYMLVSTHIMEEMLRQGYSGPIHELDSDNKITTDRGAEQILAVAKPVGFKSMSVAPCVKTGRVSLASFTRGEMTVSVGQLLDPVKGIHNATTVAGDCNTAIVNDDGLCIGIHVAGGPHGNVMIPITAKVVQTLKGLQDKPQKNVQPGGSHSTSSSQTEEGGFASGH